MLRPVALAVALALGLPAVASADLRVLSVSSPPQTRQPGKVFTVTGRLQNTGARVPAPLLSFRLRSVTGSRTYALTQTRLDPLRRDRKRSYRARLRVPANARGGAYVLQACVKRSRFARARCRSARKRLRVVLPPKVVQPGPVAPAPAPSSPAPNAPAPSAPAPAPAGKTYTPGAQTLNDPLFPGIGNGGYDAQHYALDLSYEPDTAALSGTATLTAQATQDLSAFSLDLTEWNVVSAVKVNGAAATFTQSVEKLLVTPPSGIDAGSTFTVAVTYAGTQRAYIDPDGSREGWVPGRVGAPWLEAAGAAVVAEPVGSMGWFPNNNVPFDKATYEVAVSVPDGWDVVGPGLRTTEDQGTRDRFVWTETAPTSTYLVGLGIGQYDVTDSTIVGVPSTIAVDSSFLATPMGAILDKLDSLQSMHAYFAAYFDVPYPFSSAGAIVPRQDVGYALETQSKPIYATQSDVTSTGPSLGTIAHETAHQWLGNHTTLTKWSDIWLNEGPTDLMAWLWVEDESPEGSPKTAQEEYDDVWAQGGDYWELPPAAIPSAADMFDPRIYGRGAAAIYGLLKILGEPKFKALLKQHLTAPGHAFGTATTESFIAMAKDQMPTANGKACLGVYFDEWLYEPDKPSLRWDDFDGCTIR